MGRLLYELKYFFYTVPMRELEYGDTWMFIIHSLLNICVILVFILTTYLVIDIIIYCYKSIKYKIVVERVEKEEITEYEVITEYEAECKKTSYMYIGKTIIPTEYTETAKYYVTFLHEDIKKTINNKELFQGIEERVSHKVMLCKAYDKKDNLLKRYLDIEWV